jgi:LCP family protein required for cell wall assembly
MAGEEKPYRVYRGGRVKGKVPAPAREPRRAGRDGARVDYKGPGAPRRRRGRWSRRRAILTGVLVLVLLVVVWAVASWFAFRGGVADANKRLTPGARAALTPQSGLMLSHASTILLLGSDHANVVGRTTDQHSDSILLVHTDPGRHRVIFLSIPRDLYVPIPGSGSNRINAAYQQGGIPLAVKTISDFTGLPINHVAVVDFNAFRDLIDAIGGVTVDNPKPILSNRFDCPYPTQARCQQWKGWSFPKGTLHLDGQRALIYSRVRENRLDPSETDITRGERQQAVLQAIASQLTSPGTLVQLPWIGGKLLKPLSTDLSTGQFLQLGWLKVRGHTLHCRLGGTPTAIGGADVLQPDERNRQVIATLTGQSAPQPPPPGQPYEAGCT